MKTDSRQIKLTLFLLFTSQLTITQCSHEYSANTLYNMATNCKQQGDIQKAIDYFQQALSVDPTHFETHFFLGNEYFTKGLHTQAIEIYRKALIINPKSVSTMFNLALSFDATKQKDEAITLLLQAIEIKPEHIRSRKLLARLYKEKGIIDKALEQYKSAAQYNQNDFEAQFETGELYRKKGNTQNTEDNFLLAIERYKKALEIDPYHLRTHFNLAFSYNKIGELQKSLEAYQNIMEFSPDCTDAQCNLAHTLRYLGKTYEALNHYKQVLQKWPNNAYVHYGYAESLLREGDLKNGFAEFEWRWKRGKDTRNFSEKLWESVSDLNGKVVLIRGEYGLGDTIQFIRFTKLLKNMGATVIAEVQNPLVTLIGCCPYVDQVIALGKTLPRFDFQIPVMSLPYKLDCSAEEFLDHGPYLEADASLEKQWKTKTENDTGFKIGICWNCSSYFDALRNRPSQKTLHLSEFAPIAEVENVSFYCLQIGTACNQIEDVNFTVHKFGSDFDNTHGRFMDSAALMKNLDLIITVDTSVAHLAGALGVPVWVVLPSVADWRWMKDKEDSPWYPNMRLFRQETYGNWKTVFENMKIELKKLVPNRETKKSCADIVSAEISVGELIDKITILKLKNKYIKDEKKLENIRKELDILYYTRDTKVQKSAKLDELTQELYNTNQQLWDIEIICRDKERNKQFDDEFIQTTRSVYMTNDKRCAIKRQINELLGSNLIEEKSYAAY